MNSRLIVLTLAVLSVCRLPAVELDLGGTTFDFERISSERFHLPRTGEAGNLVDDGVWQRRIELHVLKQDLPGYDAVKAAFGKTVAWQETDGVRRVTLDRAAVLRTVGEKYAACASASFVRDIALASTNGGPHTVSMRYKMRHELGDKGFLIVFYKRRNPVTGAYEMMKDIKQSYGFYDLSILENESAGWNVFSATYDMPAGAEVAEVSVRIDGAGELAFRDPGVVRAQASAKPWSLVLSPHGWLDGRFAVSSGQCGLLMTRWKKAGRVAPKAADCTFELTLPKDVEFLAANFADRAQTRCEPTADGGTRWTIAFRKGYDFSASWGDDTQPTILVRTDLPPGVAGKGSFVLKSKGAEVSNVVPIVFDVVPRIEAVAPKRLWSVMFPYEGTAEFDSPEATRAFAELMAAAGVRWVMPKGYRPETYAAWRAAGIARITPSSAIANGYHFADDRGRPEDERFIIDPASKSDNWDRYLKTATCPLAVIEGRPFYREHTLAYLREHLKGTDGLWGNWEPFMFKGRGCACARCNAAFDAWHRETGGDRAAFRSLLHGKLVRALDAEVRAATGGGRSAGFVPAVTWRSVSSAWRTLNPSPESRPQDYAASLRWLNAWGPYVYWAAETPYVYQKRGTLAHFVVARDLRAQVDADFPDAAARPKLMSMPQGLQCGNWIAQPEWIGMSMDAFAFNRWEANAPGFFPMGYDARYWRAFAAATTRAARYEDFILDGVRVDEQTELVPVVEYARPCGYVSTYLPKVRDVPMLQQVSYERGATRIVAVFNFWEKGEAFFTLACCGLAAGDYAVTDEDGVRYAKDAKAETYTAAELVKGLRLMVGAARTKVFEIRPVDKVPYSRRVTSADLAALYAKRRSALAAAAKADVAYETSNAAPTSDAKGEL